MKIAGRKIAAIISHCYTKQKGRAGQCPSGLSSLVRAQGLVSSKP
jgi:hypothetical protein